VVRAEESLNEGTFFSRTIHLVQKRGAKKDKGMFQPTWHFYMRYKHLATVRVGFERGWLKKTNLITMKRYPWLIF
jgi:hypothetical protein